MLWPLPFLPTDVLHAPRTTGDLTMTTVTTGAANTKGSWSQIYAAVDARSGSWVSIIIGNTDTAATDTATLLDLGVGAAAAETVIVPNLQCGFRFKDTTSPLAFPLYIPGGARLSARAQSVQATKAVPICVDIMGGEPAAGLTVPTKIVDYGTDTASSGGTAVTPSATAGTKGSYAQLTASTSAPIHAFLVICQGSTATQTAGSYIVDIAVGGAGAEAIVIPDFCCRLNGSEQYFVKSPEFYPLAVEIPAGTRLAARAAGSVASLQALEVAVYGLTF